MFFTSKRISAFLLTGVLLFSSLPVTAATLSPGVYHETILTTAGGYPQKVNKLSIDVTNPYAKIEYGVSNPITTRKTVTNLSKEHTYEKHHVIGAINASFFNFDDGSPVYLLAKNDQIVNLGNVSTNFNDYMYTPAAFGITADNKAKVGRYSLERTIEHNGSSFTTTDMNRQRANNELIMYTDSYTFDKTRQNQYGIEVVVTGVPKKVDSQLKFGEKVTGTVTAIRPYNQYTSSTIPKDGFVLSAQGTEVSKISSMKIGEKVSLTVDVDAAWKGSQFMLASGPLLVQEGKSALTIDLASPRVTDRVPHTAVATDATGGRAFFVTVDGRQKGYSQGMTLIEFANYLVSIGAYNAINLDGGGSTTMVTRRYGDVYPTLINRPSDGSERSVSAILEAISTAPYGQATKVNVLQDQDGIVAVGASVGYKVDMVLDQYYNALKIDQSKLVLESVTNGVGKIENNRFVGLKAGTGTITAKYDTATVSIPVTVTDTIDSLVASPSDIRIGTRESTKLTVKGVSKNQKVIFNPDAVNWTASNGVGSINGTTFTSGATEATGSITGTFGPSRVSIPVTVSNKPFQVSSLDSLTGLKHEVIRSTASLGLEKVVQAKEGTGSVKLNYDFTAFRDDTSAAYVSWTNGLAIPASPKKIGAWVYGDGENHWLRAAITDAAGRETSLDFTADGGLNWVGWKYVEANVPSTLTAPIKLSKIYVAEPSSTKKGKGSIWIDSIHAVYSNQSTILKSFNPSTSARVVDANKQFTVTFNQAMNPAFFNPKYVYVEDENGVRQNVAVQSGANTTKLVVSAPSAGYAKGKSYRLVVTHFAPNSSNIRMVKDSITEFKVQ